MCTNLPNLLVIAGLVSIFAGFQSHASETAILDAVRDGTVAPGTEIVPPERLDAAPEMGGASASINPLLNINAQEERLIVDRLFPLAAAKWPFNVVFVCWENPEPDNLDGRKWTQDAVTESWEKNSAIRFLGWQQCEPKTLGIRIRIEDSGPHVKALGKFLNGRGDGMVLNFDFANWSSSCQAMKEFCIRAVAIHEFGHAIGFAHEQNRPDAPGECALLRQGSDGDVVNLTPYDPNSIMNYCAPDWNNDGELSALDIKGVQYFYGAP